MSFSLLSLLVSLVVSVGAYGFARTYLLSQRESSALTRALLDARAVEAAIGSGSAARDALNGVPSVGESQTLTRVGGTWFTRGVTVSPQDLPASLLGAAERSGAAQQRFAIDGNPVFGVAVASEGDLYLELFPIADLDGTLRAGGWLLAGLVGLATVIGGLIGRYAGRRLMRPLRSMGEGAARIADGDLTVRLEASGDPDLDPLSSAFNDMADAVEQRIVRGAAVRRQRRPRAALTRHDGPRHRRAARRAPGADAAARRRARVGAGRSVAGGCRRPSWTCSSSAA